MHNLKDYLLYRQYDVLRVASNRQYARVLLSRYMVFALFFGALSWGGVSLISPDVLDSAVANVGLLSLTVFAAFILFFWTVVKDRIVSQRTSPKSELVLDASSGYVKYKRLEQDEFGDLSNMWSMYKLIRKVLRGDEYTKSVKIFMISRFFLGIVAFISAVLVFLSLNPNILDLGSETVILNFLVSALLVSLISWLLPSVLLTVLPRKITRGSANLG